MLSYTTFGGLLCMLVGSGTAVPALWFMWSGRRSTTWPAATGKIVSCEVNNAAFSNSESSAHPGAVLYRLKVLYSFEVAGRQIEGRRLFFGSTLWGWQRSRSAVEEEARRYTPGATVRVFHHPSWPTWSTLITGIVNDAAWLTLLFGAVFLVAGLGVFLGLVQVE